MGQLLHMDFGFYGKQSCRGFKCFLVVTEAISNHRWTFCRQSKATPVKLILWIIQHIQIRTGHNVRRIRMDGELIANNTLKTQLSLLHITAEPTGAYASSQNDKAEVSIKSIGLTAQCLMYGAQMDASCLVVFCSHLCNFPS